MNEPIDSSFETLPELVFGHGSKIQGRTFSVPRTAVETVVVVGS